MFYDLIDGDDDYLHVKITDEPYKDTVYQYGKVRVGEENSDGSVSLSFDYDIHEGDKSLEGNIEFENHIGNILVDVITKSLDTGDYRIGDKDDSTVDSNDNSEESA